MPLPLSPGAKKMAPMKLGVTGATGFIGSRLIEILLEEEPAASVVVFSRSAASVWGKLPGGERSRVETIEWDYAARLPPPGSLEGLDAIIHLAGEGIATRRWSEKQKRRIRESRVLSTRNLIEGLKSAERKPPALVCASAIGYYGPRGDEEIDEDAPPGNDFLADVCRDWETEARRASLHGVREVRIRIGIVLGLGGGALKPLLPAFRMFAGGPIGNGKQWMSWIHRDDLARLLLHASRSPEASGPLNGVSPNPVRNSEFARTLGRAVHRPAFLPTPRTALRIALGEFADVLATGQRVVPRRTLESGFRFEFAELEPALRDILRSREPSAAGRT
jgi:uncharacterized protein (TIGR01777 family)